MGIWLFLAQFATLALALAVVHRPLGDYMAAVYTSPKDLRIERGFYRVIGVDARAEQSWGAYLRSVLAFSVVGILVVYALQRLQEFLPYSLGLPATSEHLAFNTAISFVTNTNWQSYSPDTTLGYTVQLVGLAVQNFVSAAVGIAVAVALIRGFARRRDGRLCRCGGRGCVEAYLGADAILEAWRSAGGVFEGTGWGAVGQLLTAAQDGDAVASAVVDELVATLGSALGSLVNLTNPARVVVGGWVGLRLMESLAARIEQSARAESLERPGGQFELVACRFGGDTVAIGAAMMPLEALLDAPRGSRLTA
jgi:K+-transporting ATPase ATPase A chain